MSGSCQKCGGFIGDVGVPYGYAGKWCHCGWNDLVYRPYLGERLPFDSTYPAPSIQDLLKRIEELERAIQVESPDAVDVLSEAGHGEEVGSGDTFDVEPTKESVESQADPS